MQAHWSSDSVTLFTAIVYYREQNDGESELKHISYVVVSDQLTHDKKAVFSSTRKFLKMSRANYHLRSKWFIIGQMAQGASSKTAIASITWHVTQVILGMQLTGVSSRRHMEKVQ